MKKDIERIIFFIFFFTYLILVKFTDYLDSNLWLLFLLVSADGSVFYSQKLKNGETVSVYFDSSLSSDAMFYRNQLWEQYGWTLRADGYATADAYAESPSLSTLHISIKRGVALYLYPNSEFQIFRISIP